MSSTPLAILPNKISPQTQIQASNLPCQTRPAVSSLSTSTNSSRKTISSRRTSTVTSDKLLPLSRPPKISDVTWNRLTERNTERNRLYRCKIRVLVIHKDEPRPPSPSKICEESKILDQNCDMDSDMGSNNDNETDGDGRENDFGDKKVRWNRKELEAPSPAIRSSPTTARQKSIIKSCLASANPPTDRLGNVLDADKSLSPIVKRGTKITVKRIMYNDESE
ncbi:3976_t:CDS:2 [Paraglomus brasilianum]|uniref:3976_t:CDS:1 n=1 Tax=Paraglomus brasilianum TaxID=144538 RepID=A0A9N8VN22_9GLOM|nr:3976_t:CDS:2 [Paraglomus brasilianum]